MDDTGPGSKPAAKAVLAGFALGALFTLPSLVAAAMSAGAGHGDYVAARALFPVAMLMTLLEGRIGGFSIALALLQFPIYGGLLGWAVARSRYWPAVVAASVHLIAATICFAGTLPNFS